MNKKAVSILNACPYCELGYYNKVFNASTLNDNLWIYLNPGDVCNAEFLYAQEHDKEQSEEVEAAFNRVSQCWIEVDKDFVRKQVGNHTIRLAFYDKIVGANFSLYVSYYIQTDNPDKPYIYMQ